MSKPVKKITKQAVMMGCDPELFVERNGFVVGSEVVLAGSGLSRFGVEQDGVQIELHPSQSYCRQILTGDIRNCLIRLQEHLDCMSTPRRRFKITTKVGVEVSKRHMKELSSECKKFGCSPSEDIYTKMEKSIDKDGQVYRWRMAGGHIHLGYDSPITGEALLQPERVVAVLDALLGNTLVLIDRDEHNRKRREDYGRAGEFRRKPYGLEYRTPSNFWLKARPLAFLTFGLARVAVDTVCADMDKVLMDQIDTKKLQRAINNNDPELARPIYETVKKFLQEHLSAANPSPLKTDRQFEAVEYLSEVGVDKFLRPVLVENWHGGMEWNPFVSKVLKDKDNGKVQR